MVLDDAVADREAQAGPLGRPLGAEERVEDLVLHLGLDAAPGIGEDHPDRAVGLSDGDVEASAVRHGVAGVQDQVQEHLLDLVRVDLERRRIVHIRADLDLFELMVVPHQAQRVLQDVPEARRHLLARVEPREIAQVPHDPRDAVHLPVDRRERLPDKGLQLLGLELLHQRGYGSERVADLVGHAGGKPAYAGVLGRPEQLLFDLLLLGDVLKDQHVSFVGAGELAQVPLENDLGLEVPAAGDLAFLHQGSEEARFEAGELLLGKAVHGVGLFHAGDHLHAGVPVFDAQRLIERGHAEGQALDDVLAELFQQGKLTVRLGQLLPRQLQALRDLADRLRDLQRLFMRQERFVLEHERADRRPQRSREGPLGFLPELEQPLVGERLAAHAGFSDKRIDHVARLRGAKILRQHLLDLAHIELPVVLRELERRIGIDKNDGLAGFGIGLFREERYSHVEQQVQQQSPEKRMAPAVKAFEAEQRRGVQHPRPEDLLHEAARLHDAGAQEGRDQQGIDPDAEPRDDAGDGPLLVAALPIEAEQKGRGEDGDRFKGLEPDVHETVIIADIHGEGISEEHASQDHDPLDIQHHDREILERPQVPEQGHDKTVHHHRGKRHGFHDDHGGGGRKTADERHERDERVAGVQGDREHKIVRRGLDVSQQKSAVCNGKNKDIDQEQVERKKPHGLFNMVG